MHRLSNSLLNEPFGLEGRKRKEPQYGLWYGCIVETVNICIMVFLIRMVHFAFCKKKKGTVLSYSSHSIIKGGA
jgi:hypothetical protein